MSDTVKVAMKSTIRRTSFAILVALLHGCAYDGAPRGDAAVAQRSDPVGFSDSCQNRPSTSIAPPAATVPGAGLQWIPSSRDRWTIALVGYQGIAERSTRVRFSDRKELAHCLISMHNRIHPRFSERYFASLSAQPASDPRNDMTLATLAEIVIARDGSISQMGVICSSGNEDFDIGVLDSISRAAPFEPPPQDTRSSDDKFYVRWWFHRDPTFGCALLRVRPYKLVIDAGSGAGGGGAR